MPNLPPDIITDILSRLPVQSLLRFRCVSKLWCTLIDGPYFIKLHLKRSIDTNINLSLILINRDIYSVDLDTLNNTVVELDYPLKRTELGVKVWGFCNGLLCLSSNCLSSSDEDVLLWNPSTRTHHTLPVTPIEFSIDYHHEAIFFGFGHDHVNDDYKVVRIVQFYNEDSDYLDGEAKVYSLKTNSWKRIKDCPYYLKDTLERGIFSNGALHWVVFSSRKLGSLKWNSLNSIVAFDIGAEKYRTMPQPDLLDNDSDVNVNVLGGYLCLICDDPIDGIDVWVMKDYGVEESWTKLFSFAPPDYGIPLDYSKGGAVVFLSPDGDQLVWYVVEMDSKRVEKVMICDHLNWVDAGICVGSLVCPNGDNGIYGKKAVSMEEKEQKEESEEENLSNFEEIKANKLGSYFLSTHRTCGVAESFDAEICIGSPVPLNGGSGIDGKKQLAEDENKNS